MKFKSFFIAVALISCAESSVESKSSEISDTAYIEKVELEIVDFEPAVDSVWYHNLYKLGKNKVLGIAQPIIESKKGIRLQLLKLESDSNVTLISESQGAFDSYVYLPTFFQNGDELLMLVNTGYTDSWGNRIVRLKDDSFEELGYIDAGIAIRTEEPNEYDSLYYVFGNIANCARISMNAVEISFDCDSLVLFDDGKGNLNRIIGGHGMKYVFKNGTYSLETNLDESS